MSSFIEVTDENFEKEVVKSDVPVLVDFWAQWCVPCKMIAPLIEEVAGEFGDKIKVVKMDVDSSPETPANFGITGIPTLIVFKNGEPVEKVVGAVPKNKIKSLIENSIG